jgi:hypothetical protein
MKCAMEAKEEVDLSNSLSFSFSVLLQQQTFLAGAPSMTNQTVFFSPRQLVFANSVTNSQKKLHKHLFFLS